MSGWNRDITKIWKQLVLKPEPEQKCENNAIVAQKYSLKLFIGFKMSCSCYTQLRGKSIFPRFAQKKFYNIDNGSEPFWKRLLCWVFFAVAISYDYKASVTKFKRKFLNSSFAYYVNIDWLLPFGRLQWKIIWRRAERMVEDTIMD